MSPEESPILDTSAFLAGHGEMARRIREFDWEHHPFGRPEGWPLALRSALGICLNSAFPVCIYWGPERRLIYNDAWSFIPGPRHPECLGQPAREVWSDIWHIIEPQFEQVLRTGEGVYLRDQMLPMRRFGFEEETYWDYNFTPIFGADGRIGGIFNSGNETTDKVLRDRHTRFLLELSDAFRGMTEAAEVRSQPLEMLGRHLGVERVGLRQRKGAKSAGYPPVVEQWAAPGVEPVPFEKVHPARGEDLRAQLLDGHVILLDGRDPRRKAVEKEILKALDCMSALAVPWSENGETVAILFVHSLRPRQWTDLDVQTVEAVIQRIMFWLDRARAMERERVLSREIDHRARNLLSIVRSIIRLARAEDPEVMREKLMDRIAALGKTHSLLSENRQGALVLNRLVEDELEPFRKEDAEAIQTDGPEIALTPDQSQAFAMALHELGTNAAKHGSLSQEGGRLSVTWGVTSDDHLRLEWIETGCSGVKKPACGEKGFGMRLLNLVIESQLDGRLEHELRDTGLRCVMEVPWAQ